ncbi:hypothetical protein SISSUDRAFT_1065366 [Sistotremastrum suecicum HHB10207 ss-3]|uniref:NACHT domain-containing protein n=1 Tax=Sistotremastrum suecicum HHB10207 ss-3 TaxID=1314776 RepID=A0A165ZKH3_9AGAM|nr:hypothetical protein SISSUDRAFT_1065366 [Sistotremastrum suecicum HHB10207 ss-3]
MNDYLVTSDNRGGSLTVKIYIKHAIGSDVFFGTVTAEIAELAAELLRPNIRDGDEEWTKPRRLVTGAHEYTDPIPTLSFKFTPSSQTGSRDEVSATLSTRSEEPSPPLDLDLERLTKATEAAKKAVEGLRKAPVELQKSSDYSEVAKSAADILTPDVKEAGEVFDNIGVFVGIIDTIAEIHPYAKLAWGVISLPFKISKAQLDRDKELSELVSTINSTYEKINRLWTSLEQEYQKSIVTRLLIHSVNCGAFLCEECINHPDFFKRALRSRFTAVDRKIQDFKSGFKDLQDELLRSTALEAQVVGQKTYTSVRDTRDQAILDTLKYVASADFGSKSGCYPNTRIKVIEEITRWFEAAKVIDGTKTGASIYWLRGHAGSGKSAIAHSITKKFHDQKCLGSSFFFDASNAVKRRAEDLFSTIARNLASLIPSFAEALVDVIQSSSDVRTTTSVRRQFEELILNPAQRSKHNGHVIVVIDALDECGYSSLREYQALLDILSSGREVHGTSTGSPTLRNLPSNFHFLLTSRPDSDIEEAFARSQHVHRKDLWAVSDEEVETDLETYYRNRLEEFTYVPDLLHRFDTLSPAQGCIRILTTRSERLFQWAFTTCEFLLQDDPVEDIVERFQTLLEVSHLSGLEDLYTKILEKVAGAEGTSRLSRFRAVLGRVLCVREPLSLQDITALRGTNEDSTTSEFFVKRMGSVLSGAGVVSISVIQVFHTSFRDFLFREYLAAGKKNIYHVDPHEQDAVLAQACLRVLNSQLAFNLCQIQSSYTAHNPQLAAQCKASLRSQSLGHLIYASIYWSSHLVKTDYNEAVASLLHTFIDCQFLHWLELLGAIGEIYVSVGAIRTMTEWATGYDDKVAEFGKDARKFVSNFAHVIARSPPHLYISALPFAPESSLVSQRYLPRFSGTLIVQSGKQQIWSPVDLIFGDRGDFRTKEVLSIAYSPDGKVLIAVTDNKLIWLWNPSTGQSIASFYETEASPACIVEISPDGRYFAVGSKRGEIVLRDLKTQRLIWGPKCVQGQKIVSLRFSRDSEKLWAGDWWAYLGAWDVQTGNNRFPVEELHGGDGTYTVIAGDASRLACAPSGISLVLFHRNDDDTAWSDRRKIATFTDAVFALTFSPDGQRLVSGHDSGTIKMWDVESGDLHGDHSTAHTNQIRSLAFSSDGLFFASSSFDQTIQVWDGMTRDPIGNALSGFGEIHLKIAISADGKSVATTIGDGGIYVWDTAGMKESALLGAKLGSGPYPSVIALSPDGKHLYAARSDHSICEYDMETGAELGTVMRGHRSRIWHLSVLRDGTHLVSCSSDTTISIWDIEAPMKTHKSLTGHTNEVVFTAFSPDGTRLLSCSTDRTLRIWDTATSETLGEPLTGHTNFVMCAAFFDEGQRIISGSYDRTIRVWDPDTGNQIGESLELHTGGVNAMALSPTNNILTSADTRGVIHLWYPPSTTSSLRRHHTIHHGTDRINSVSFSADGARLLSASADHTICLWDVSTGELIGRPFEGHSGDVIRAFFLDEERIISSSYDGTIRIWDIDATAEAPGTKPEAIGQANLQRYFRRIDYDGWVRSEDDPPKLLFWLPLHYRPVFQWSRCRKIIGREALDIDFSRFEHGERWANCRSPR